jgi:signal transduction histidine kinase
MLTIYFFYGLAFIILSAVVFLMPRRENCFGLEKSIIFMGWFGFLHGLNEWVELLISAGRPFNTDIMVLIGSALLPLSFIFLIVFGCVTISNTTKFLRWLNAAWIVFPLLWIGLSITVGDSLISAILARYLLCVPGAVSTCLAIYMSLRGRDVQKMPKPVVAGAWLSATFFLLYGIFSGLVTPKASFFPASALNYSGFLEIFHLPVQLFRMVCALIISCGLILLMGVSSAQRPGQSVKGTIKKKLTLIIAASVTIVTLSGAMLTYFAGSAILMRLSGKEYSQIAHMLSIYTVEALKGEIEDAQSYTTRVLWRDAVAQTNARYDGMDARAIEQKLLDTDKIWIAANSGDPILKECLESRVALGMRDIQDTRKSISEIFITDKYGGLVAASGKTSDFYQADEEWWQRAYNSGKGGVYVSDIEFDESSKSWVISIAVPIRDHETGEVIGICKDSVGVDRLFRNLADFRLGNTGHAALIDYRGSTIYHEGIPAMTRNTVPEKTLREMLSMKNSYLVIKDSLLHGKKTFVAFDEIRPPYLSNRGVLWIVMLGQDMSEVYEPIRDFIIQIAIISILMIVMIIPIGSFFGKLIADPIHELHLATERVMAGDWDFKIDIKTGDEIEQFAGTFRDMVAAIQSKQKEIQDFSDSLEVKVQDRTRELSLAQEATLNILEDLQASKEALERMNKELMKLDELKSDFISTVSHELRTPLSIIKEGISLVLDKIPGNLNEKQSKILDISKYNIDRLARIIDGLLDVSKMEAGKVEMKRSLIDVSGIVRQVASSFGPKIKEKGLEMRLDVDNVVGNVWADTDRITQVMVNLIGNAIKFTNSGHIDISCKDKGDGVVCSVADTGVGISKDDLPKVFAKFQQFGRTAGAGDKGTGLGLSIVKNIIDMHNGAIWVESEFGKGSRFAFKLHKYTPQSLFREQVAKAFKAAADKNGDMSIIAANFSLTGRDGAAGTARERFSYLTHECSGIMKGALRREDDDVVESEGEMIIILTDCGKEGAAKVQFRLEGAVNRYLADQNANQAIKVNYGCSTYPDDARSGPELIEKAKAALAVSVKA